jgi:phage N-6-adenine-methyltransferase
MRYASGGAYTVMWCGASTGGGMWELRRGRKMVVDKALFSSDKQDWETPQWLFDELNSEFNFWLDVCATENNSKCEHCYTIDDNALIENWRGVCWCNPPYGREVGQWVEKAHRESQSGATVVMLLPARTDTRWFWDYIMPFNISLNANNLKFAWAAGVFDGEGCVFIRKNKPSKDSKQASIIHDLGMKVSMTDKQTIEKLYSIFKCGHIREEQRGGNWKTAWHWVCRSKDAVKVLSAIYPHSITKKNEIYEAIKFSLLPSGQHGQSRVPADLIEKREESYQTLRRLKKDKTGHVALTTEIRFLRGRLKFAGAKNSAPFPSMIVVFRP